MEKALCGGGGVLEIWRFFKAINVVSFFVFQYISIVFFIFVDSRWRFAIRAMFFEVSFVVGRGDEGIG